MGNKGKAPSSEDKEMTPLYTDTTCNKYVDITTWEGMYNLLEEENPKVMEVTTIVGSHGSSKASIIELECSFLHRIVAGPKILPYTNMVKWVLFNADIMYREFKAQKQECLRCSFHKI